MKRCIQSLLVSLWFVCTAGLAEQSAPATAVADPANAKFLATFDQWENGGAKGTVRVLVTPAVDDPQRSLVYLQWIEESKSAGGSLAVRSQVGVREINDKENLMVLGVGASRAEVGSLIDLQLRDVVTGVSRSIRIQSGAPGVYSLTEETGDASVLAARRGDDYFEWLLDFYWPTF